MSVLDTLCVTARKFQNFWWVDRFLTNMSNAPFQFAITISNIIFFINFLFFLQGFIHVLKKPGGLKPELIDVDLVIGKC